MLTPKTEDDLARVVAEADAPLRIQGGGTRPVGMPTNGTVLSTSALSGIELYEPGSLTLVAKAGTPVAEIEAALDAESQRLAFEPMDHRGLLGTTGTPTIGGVAAANVSGPRRIQAGAARDFMLGVRFVDGRGQIIKNGGRVMKNVTGYDLVKLMAGSYGTLGVLTEVSLKVLPKPRFAATLRIEGLADAAAVAALGRALGSPYEVSGAAHLQGDDNSAPTTLLRLEGFENSVAYRAAKLQSMLADLGQVKVDASPAETDATWAAIRDVAPYHKADGDVWRISVKPTNAPGLVAGLSGARAFYDWGGGLIWLLAPQGSGVNAQSIRAAVAKVGGHATLIRGNPSAGVFQPLSPAVAALQDGLRLKFDPKQILNPGLMTQGQAA